MRPKTTQNLGRVDMSGFKKETKRKLTEASHRDAGNDSWKVLKETIIQAAIKNALPRTAMTHFITSESKSSLKDGK